MRNWRGTEGEKSSFSAREQILPRNKDVAIYLLTDSVDHLF